MSSTEIIEKIENVVDDAFCLRGESCTASGSGYSITTNKQVIKLLIDNDQQCCEHWGYFITEDNLDFFIGAELLDITLTDIEMKTKSIAKLPDSEDVYTMFVNIITTRGTFQFVAYNEHNGYYGHISRVISEQLEYDIEL